GAAEARRRLVRRAQRPAAALTRRRRGRLADHARRLEALVAEGDVSRIAPSGPTGAETAKAPRGGRFRELAMGAGLDLLAAGAQLGDDGGQAALVDGAHGAGGHAQADPALLVL